MNKTKFQIGEHVTLKYASENPGQVMSIDKIRSNARGENEYQLTHLTEKNPPLNYDWFNEENLMFTIN